jgi:two-component system, OmpR family, sensor histidine kinase KdpD
MMEYVGVLALLAACTLVGTIVLPLLSVTDIAMLFLAAVALSASRVRRGAAVFAAFLSIALFDFFFVPPRFTFAVSDLHYLFTFAVMLTCALTISELSVRLRSYGEAARERERRTAELYAMGHELVPTLSVADLVGVISRHVRQAFGADVVVLLRGPDGQLAPLVEAANAFTLDDQERSVAQWAFDHWHIAGAGTAQFSTAQTLFVPLVAASGRFGVLGLRASGGGVGQLGEATVQSVLETFAGQAALALEHARALRAEGAGAREA